MSLFQPCYILGLRWQVTETTEEPKGKNPAKNPGRLQNWDVDAVRQSEERDGQAPRAFSECPCASCLSQWPRSPCRPVNNSSPRRPARMGIVKFQIHIPKEEISWPSRVRCPLCPLNREFAFFSLQSTALPSQRIVWAELEPSRHPRAGPIPQWDFMSSY